MPVQNLINNTFSKIILLSIFCLGIQTKIAAQPDLLDLIEDDSSSAEKTKYPFVEAAFKTTRLINGHTIETTHHGVLDFRISHRFAPVNGGFYNLFGLDQASVRFGFDYGLSNNFTIGVGRSSYEKSYDGFFKYKFLKQREKGFSPISAVWISGMSVNTLHWPDPNRTNYFSSRLNYYHQLLVAKKVSDGFSFQLSPTLVHRNLVATASEDNDVLSLGIGFRQKLSKRTSFNFEYFYAPKGSIQDRYNNSLSLGFDIETGGHVFQLHFTNSQAMIEKGFITETSQSWKKAGFMFGFNVSRVFNIKSYDY